MRQSPLFAALSPNGRIVHLATRSGRPVCGSKVEATCRVHARVTCHGCRRRQPLRVARLADRPLVIGVNWAPLYTAYQRALEKGLREAPRVKVPFWPVLAPAKRATT